jgi:hypothetical protein
MPMRRAWRSAKTVQIKALEHSGQPDHQLARDLDNIVDSLDGNALCLVLFELAESPEVQRQLAAEEMVRVTGMERETGSERQLTHERSALEPRPRSSRGGDRSHSSIQGTCERLV